MIKVVIMISDDNLEKCKEVLYNEYKSKNTRVIGGLDKLRSVLDTVVNDTSYNKFRIVEACHWLDGHGYLHYLNSSDNPNMFGVVIFIVTDKLIKEMEDKQKQEKEQEENNLKSWY